LDTIKTDAEMVGRILPPRRKDAHKRANGTVCVVGGSRLYHGAPFLCAMGAMRAGVDLVYIAVPASIATAVRSLSPDFIVIPLPDAKLTRGNVSKLMTWVPRVDAFAVGPGLGEQRPELVVNALNQMKGDGRSLVVDADALRPQIVPSIRGTKTVVTPHAGEFERLFAVKLPDDTTGRVKAVMEQAKKAGVTVLLKGPTDVISDGNRAALNDTHSPAMTVGGTGDVLTGITGALLAKNVPPFDAACAAAYISGSAGVEAAKEFGMHITASDVANNVATAMKRFDVLV
jgi:ADP-dependent NAD(P)H-hydrate dehydratase